MMPTTPTTRLADVAVVTAAVRVKQQLQAVAEMHSALDLERTADAGRESSVSSAACSALSHAMDVSTDEELLPALSTPSAWSSPCDSSSSSPSSTPIFVDLTECTPELPSLLRSGVGDNGSAPAASAAAPPPSPPRPRLPPAVLRVAAAPQLVTGARKPRQEELRLLARCHPLSPALVAAIRAVRVDDADTLRAVVEGNWRPPHDVSTTAVEAQTQQTDSTPSALASLPPAPQPPLPVDLWIPPSLVELRDGRTVDPLGLDLDQPTTLLHLACRTESLRCVELLVCELRVPVGLMDSQRALALDDCAFHNAVRCARLLVSLGCDPAHLNNGGASMLHTAAAAGNAEFVRYCCEEVRMDVEQRCRDGWTPLQWATEAPRNACDTVRALVDAGADVNARDRQGNTALMWALGSTFGYPNPDVVRLLVRCKADLSIRNAEGQNAFESQLWDSKAEWINADGHVDLAWRDRPRGKHAAPKGRGRSGKRKQSQRARKQQPAPRKRNAAQQQRPAESEDAEQSVDLIEDERKAEESTGSPQLACDSSSLRREAPATELPSDASSLDASGAAGGVGSSRASSPSPSSSPAPSLPLPCPPPYFDPPLPLSRLDVAESRVPLCFRHESLMGRCKRYLFQETLNRAVEAGDFGDVERVRSLLSEWDAAHERHRMFPLQYDASYPIGPMQIAVAFESDDTAILELLLRARIDPHKKTATGFLPIHAAANVGNPHCVRMLLDQGGCDPNLAEETDGYTALMMAADDVNGGEVVDVLLQRADIDVNRSDHHGNTALIWAVFKGNSKVLRLLLQRRELRRDTRNKWGNTAMHYAFYRGQSEGERVGASMPQALAPCALPVHAACS